MPNIRTHDFITTVSGVVLFPVSWILLPDHSLTGALTITAAHLLAGLLFSPDLDLRATNYRRWGPLRGLWWPYSKAVPHRSWISHGLIVGPLLQLLYFLVVFGGAFAALLLIVGQYEISTRLLAGTVEVIQIYPGYMTAFLIGFVTGGASHSIPDWLSTGTKRTWNSWTRF